MKLNSFKTLALAFAALASVATLAQAQTTLNYNTGDLLIGFDAGSANDYIIDVGQASQFNNVTGTITLSGLGNIAADLSSASLFGTNWHTTSTVKWGGIATDDNNAVWATSATVTPWNNAGNFSAAESDIDSIGGNFGGSTSTANSNVGFIEATSGGASWASFESVANGGTGANSNSGSLATFVPGIMDATSSNLYLDKLTQHGTGTGQELGFFQINNAGVVTFTGAVPEPSTYALMILGSVLMLGVTLRRRANNA